MNFDAPARSSPSDLLGIVLLCLATSTGLAETRKAAPYRSADFPPVLEFLDGRPVKTKEDWVERRAEIKKLWCDTYLGHFPEAPPKLLEA